MAARGVADDGGVDRCDGGDAAVAVGDDGDAVEAAAAIRCPGSAAILPPNCTPRCRHRERPTSPRCAPENASPRPRWTRWRNRFLA